MKNIITSELAELLKKYNFKKPVYFAYIRLPKYEFKLEYEAYLYDYVLEYYPYDNYNLQYIRLDQINYDNLYPNNIPLLNYNYSENEINELCKGTEFEKYKIKKCGFQTETNSEPYQFDVAISAPTYDEVIEWLREKHSLHIKIDFLYSIPHMWHFEIKTLFGIIPSYEYASYDNVLVRKFKYNDINEAKHAAIITCLLYIKHEN